MCFGPRRDDLRPSPDDRSASFGCYHRTSQHAPPTGAAAVVQVAQLDLRHHVDSPTDNDAKLRCITTNFERGSGGATDARGSLTLVTQLLWVVATSGSTN